MLLRNMVFVDLIVSRGRLIVKKFDFFVDLIVPRGRLIVNEFDFVDISMNI